MFALPEDGELAPPDAYDPQGDRCTPEGKLPPCLAIDGSCGAGGGGGGIAGRTTGRAGADWARFFASCAVRNDFHEAITETPKFASSTFRLKQ